MNVEKNDAVVSRRGFLKGVAAAGGAVAASAVMTETANAAVPGEPAVDDAKEEKAQGYHVTPHVLEYYEKARF